MKKLFIMCMVLLLTGCGTEKENMDILQTELQEQDTMQTQEQEKLTDAEAMAGTEEQADAEAITGTGEQADTEAVTGTGERAATEAMTETMLDLDTYSLENKDDTYGQPEFLNNSAASSDLGIYYWGKSIFHFYDKNAKVGVPLCNRPNCSHDSNDCNAAFGIFQVTELDMYRGMVYYYDGAVYLVGDENGYVNLYKVKPDGSSWKKDMTLFKAEKTVEIMEDGGTSTYWRYPDVCLHQDYVYYIDNSESHPKLRRIQMGGTKTEMLFEPEGDRTMLYRMKCYGDFVFFQAGKYVGEELKAGIYAYNIKTGETSLVKAEVLREYYVAGKMLYYEQNESIFVYDLKTGETKELPIVYTSMLDKDFFVDENGIYVFHGGIGELTIYDKDGNQEAVVMDGQVSFCYFGTDGIFYGEALVGDTYKEVFLHVEEARTKDGTWTYIR